MLRFYPVFYLRKTFAFNIIFETYDGEMYICGLLLGKLSKQSYGPLKQWCYENHSTYLLSDYGRSLKAETKRDVLDQRTRTS